MSPTRLEGALVVEDVEETSSATDFRCPKCHGPLREEATEIVCLRHGRFPIKDGIPSFCDRVGNEFDHHWQSNTLSEIPKSKRIVATEFLSSAVEHLNKRRSLKCLDAGCGDGVHIDVLSRDVHEHGNHSIVGVDLSRSALQIAAHRQHRQCQFAQSDIAELPFAAGTFDIVFSFGVLAYTDSPTNSFSELCRVLKPGGMIGIWVCPESHGFLGAVLRFVRKTSQSVGPFLTRRIADLLVPILGVLPTRSRLSLRTATWAQCREVVLVNIAPQQLVFPSVEHVRSWFLDNDVAIATECAVHPITIWGIKSSN